MRTTLPVLAVLAALACGCAGPELKDPLAGLGADGPAVAPAENPDFKALTVGYILSENSRNTAAYINRTNVSAYAQMDKRIAEFQDVFKKHFKKVVRISRIEDAVDARADLVVVLDVYAHYHTTVFHKQRIVVKAVVLAPDRTQIDIVSFETFRKGSDARLADKGLGVERVGAALSMAAIEAQERLEYGLFASQKIQDFARAASAGKPASAAVAAEKPAPAAPRPAPASSNVDKPTYAAPEDPDKFAVVVGVEKYASLPAADFAHRDAEAVRAHLIALGFAPRRIKFLSGPMATRSKLAAYLEDWLPKNVTPASTVFFYYSGHGAPDARAKQGYLLPADGDPEYLERTGYALSELYKRLGALPAKRVVVALDSCFSGAGGRSVLPKGTRPIVTHFELDPMAGGKVVTLAAAKSDQISGTMIEHGHGAFTYYMLMGLNGAAARDGRVTLQSLYEYLRPKVEDAASLDNRDQAPQLFPADAPAVILR